MLSAPLAIYLHLDLQRAALPGPVEAKDAEAFVDWFADALEECHAGGGVDHCVRYADIGHRLRYEPHDLFGRNGQVERGGERARESERESESERE